MSININSQTSPTNLRTQTTESLINLLLTTKTHLLTLRQKQHSSVIKPSEIKKSKQLIARILTILHEKKITEIVNKSYLNKQQLPVKLLPKKSRKVRNGLSLKQMKASKNGKFIKVKMPLFSYNNGVVISDKNNSDSLLVD
ncbi:60S ribosomal protein L35-2 [Cucumispora dikerogammari]|nr:60S ribosomal protein L35-2 [Cucumispora dikerogammari]